MLLEARGDVQEAIDDDFTTWPAKAAVCSASPRRRRCRTSSPCTVRDPIGVVGLITPWNFPMAVPSWKLMPALIAGNTVVWKPAEDTPLVSLAFVKLHGGGGLAAGRRQRGARPRSSRRARRWWSTRSCRVISFTGSTATGTRDRRRSGAAWASACSLEMGGKNAITVMDDANLDLAVEGILWSAFGTTGQRCTAASRLIVHRAVMERADGAAGRRG